MTEPSFHLITRNEKSLNDLHKKVLHYLKLLPEINGFYDASPYAISMLPSSKSEAYDTLPDMVIPDEVDLFRLAMTTNKNEDFPIDTYIHGIERDTSKNTDIVWREEVSLINIVDGFVEFDSSLSMEDLLDLYPIKPLEVITDSTERVIKSLKVIAKRNSDLPVCYPA